jgi:hypothetical protein
MTMDRADNIKNDINCLPCQVIEFLELIVSNVTTNSLKSRRVREAELLSLFKAITTGVTFEVLIYFLKNRVATSSVVIMETGLPYASVYRAIKVLKSIGFLHMATKVRNNVGVKGGPRPNVWALPGTREEQVWEAVNRHNKISSDESLITEKLIEELMESQRLRVLGEITRQEILIVTRSSTFLRGPDLVKMADRIGQHMMTVGIEVVF